MREHFAWSRQWPVLDQPTVLEKSSGLNHGTGAILQPIQPEEVVIVPSEASNRDWVSVQSNQFNLAGGKVSRSLSPSSPGSRAFSHVAQRLPSKALRPSIGSHA